MKYECTFTVDFNGTLPFWITLLTQNWSRLWLWRVSSASDSRAIPIQILIQMANIIVCRTVSTEPILIPIPMQMGTVPNLTLISVLIRWFFK